VIFCLAKILRSKKFGQTNDLRVFFRRITNEFIWISAIFVVARFGIDGKLTPKRAKMAVGR